MSTPFVRTLRSLGDDHPVRSLPGLALAAALLAGWAGWFFGARMDLYERSLSARLETEQASFPVEAPVGGRVVEVSFSLGQRVRAGDVLVALDDREQALELGEVRARLAGLEGQLGPLRHELALAEQVADRVRLAGVGALGEARAQERAEATEAAHAEQEAARLAQLHDTGGATQAQRERAESEAEAMRASAEAARHAVAKLRSETGERQAERLRDVEALRRELRRVEAEIAAASARADRLRHETDERRIVAPVDGRIGETSRLRVGSVVRAGDRLATVVPEGRVRVVAEFAPEAAFGRIRAGQQARMRLHGFPWTRYGILAARVDRVGSEVRDGAVRVELTVRPRAGSPIPIEHGLPGEVEVRVERLAPVDLALISIGRALD